MASDSSDKANTAFTEIMRGLSEIRRAILTAHPEMLVELAPSFVSVEDNVCSVLRPTS